MRFGWNQLPKELLRRPSKTKGKGLEETTQMVQERFPEESEEWVEEVSVGIYGMVEIMYECWLKSKSATVA